MRVLRRKLLRELRQDKGRFIAASFLVFLGMALFLSCWLGYVSLDHSYKSASEQLKYNDFIIQVKEAPDDSVNELSSVNGVSEVTARLSMESGCDMPGGNNIVCQLIGMPSGSQPDVNQLLIENGSYFDSGAEDSCILESHLADHYGLDPEIKIDVAVPAGKEELNVVGVGASAEYFMVSSPRSAMASPENFGVIFVPQDWLQETFGKEGLSNQLCFRVNPDADASEVMSDAENALSQYGVLSATLGNDTESRQLLDMDVEGFRQMSIFFPVLFLLIAGLSLFMILTRIVHMQRPQIGTMMAFGVGRRQLTVHYVSFALLVGTFGAVLGLVAGYFLGLWFTHMYANSLGVPLISTVMDWAAVAEGFVVAVLASLLAGILPIWRLVKRAPADVIREMDEDIKAVSHKSLLERVLPPLKRAKLTTKIPLRNISRNRRRALLNVLGITFAFILLLLSFSFLNTLNAVFNFYADDFIQYDADVYFTTPVKYAEQVGDISGIPAVKNSSPYLISPGRFTGNEKTLGDGMLQAVPRDTELLGFYDLDGKKVELPTEGAMLSQWFNQGLGLKEGDTIKLETSVGDLEIEVKGFVKQMGGLTAFADLSWIQQKAGADIVNGIFVESSGPQGNELRDDLLSIPGAAGVEIPKFTAEEIKTDFMSLMYTLAGIMTLFAAAMAISLIYNTVNIAYLERETEIAVMMALGTSLKRVRRMFSLENMLIGVFAVIPGILAGWGFSVWMWKSYSSEYFTASAVITPVSYLITILGGLAFVYLAELPSLRKAKNIDIATLIRDRIR